jgi:hypothetical protein
MLLSPARPARAGTNRRPATAPTARGRGRYHGCATCSGLYYCIQKGCCSQSQASLYVWIPRKGRPRTNYECSRGACPRFLGFVLLHENTKKISTKVLKQGLIQTVMRLI